MDKVISRMGLKLEETIWKADNRSAWKLAIHSVA